MKEKTFLVADTETTGIRDKAIVFDFAYAIATRSRDILERSFVVRETITNPSLMLGAYCDQNWRAMFGGKIFRHYIPALHTHTIDMKSWADIVGTLRDDMATHNVDVFSAYNLRFDIGALTKTARMFAGPEKILAYKPTLLCLWQFSCETVCQSKLYNDLARELDWTTDRGNIKTSAEKVYAFLTCQPDFIEAHTALEDVEIEVEILRRLLHRKKKIPYNVLDHMPWRMAQKFGG